jgi:hypothetical protein
MVDPLVFFFHSKRPFVPKKIPSPYIGPMSLGPIYGLGIFFWQLPGSISEPAIADTVPRPWPQSGARGPIGKGGI